MPLNANDSYIYICSHGLPLNSRLRIYNSLSIISPEYWEGTSILNVSKVEWLIPPTTSTSWHPHSGSCHSPKPLNHLGFSFAFTFYLEIISMFCWLFLGIFIQAIHLSPPILLAPWSKSPSAPCTTETDLKICPLIAHMTSGVYLTPPPTQPPCRSHNTLWLKVL